MNGPGDRQPAPARPARRALQRTGRLLATLLPLLLGPFAALALWFQLGPGALRLGLVAGWVLVSLAALFGLVTGRLAALLPFALAAPAFVVWWATLAPTNTADWQPDVARMATATVEGDRITFHDVRAFDWITRDTAREAWTTRTVSLAAVSGVDLFFSYWSGPAIAHVVVSFTFDDAPPLAFSIETRKRVGQAYSPLAGFFKSYGLVIIAADERDLIRLRTNVRGEDVRLYRLSVGRENARRLLLAYAAALNRLAARPAFYDTLRDNCTTLAFRFAGAIWPDLRPDWRVLLPGYGPDYAYEIGAVDTSLPLPDLKAKAEIGPAARAAGDSADFSAAIRAGVPRPPAE